MSFILTISILFCSGIFPRMGWADDSPGRVLVVYNENWPDEDGDGISDSELSSLGLGG